MYNKTFVIFNLFDEYILTLIAAGKRWEKASKSKDIYRDLEWYRERLRENIQQYLPDDIYPNGGYLLKVANKHLRSHS